jgi:hypothetical protein
MSGKNLDRIRIIGLFVTTVGGIVGIWYTLTHLNYGSWVIYTGNLMCLFATILIVGFIIFVLEWEDVTRGIDRRG